MCTSSTEWINPPHTLFAYTRRQRSKRPKVQVHRLTRSQCMGVCLFRRRKRRCEDQKVGKDMELKNLKLYMKNLSILEENEKLRKKASLLHEENLALMSEIHKKFTHFNCLSTTLFLLQNTTSIKL
ncbi:protein LITTLE ZIPPER 2-like isoform X1 [Camellia sinensis]|uniref:Uncharacterized protein n=2 Tax=Camellia sinensis TaxID=4442 RepID=A0A7J7HNX3_CAMSI|nr:protein LITTLE ZIPPER 2-like isoform X1 [Camellia sinensis]KAF5954429.1 hypothetical protein HYC85_007285 [Camellia sinensis]THG14000.1 hypothetical protein TEA_022773 [Camellia sinensis var. sinensis]